MAQHKSFLLKVTASNVAVTEFFSLSKSQLKKITDTLGPTDVFKIHRVA